MKIDNTPKRDPFSLFGFIFNVNIDDHDHHDHHSCDHHNYDHSRIEIDAERKEWLRLSSNPIEIPNQTTSMPIAQLLRPKYNHDSRIRIQDSLILDRLQLNRSMDRTNIFTVHRITGNYMFFYFASTPTTSIKRSQA